MYQPDSAAVEGLFGRGSRPARGSFSEVMQEHIRLTIKYVRLRVAGSPEQHKARGKLLGQVRKWETPFLGANRDLDKADQFKALLTAHIGLVNVFVVEALGAYAKDGKIPEKWRIESAGSDLVSQNLTDISDSLAKAVTKGKLYSLKVKNWSLRSTRLAIESLWGDHINCTVRYIGFLIEGRLPESAAEEKLCLRQGKLLGSTIDEMVRTRPISGHMPSTEELGGEEEDWSRWL